MFAWFQKTSPENRGALLLVLGISIFGFSDNLTLLVSDKVGVGQFHLYRSVFAILLIIAVSRFLGYSMMPVRWKPMIARTAFMVIAILVYFSVMPMMPIAEAGAGLFTSPIFVLLFSSLFFKERIGWRRALAVAVGTVGVLLILKPGQAGFSPFHMLPILSGALTVISKTWVMSHNIDIDSDVCIIYTHIYTHALSLSLSLSLSPTL